jgi:type IV pili sensor histidine kinase/response regulator
MLLSLFRSCAALCLLLPLAAVSQDLIQTGRYTVISPLPTEAQKEPLTEIIAVGFPDTVTTVGEAMRHLLAGTGYALSDSVYADSDVFGFIGRPLPDVQRNLGPLAVSVALQTLAGSAFRVTVDPIRRLVGVELDPSVRVVDGAAVPEEGA